MTAANKLPVLTGSGATFRVCVVQGGKEEAGGVSRTSRGGGESGGFTGRHVKVELDLKGWDGGGDSLQGGRPDKDKSSKVGCWQGTEGGYIFVLTANSSGMPTLC